MARIAALTFVLLVAGCGGDGRIDLGPRADCASTPLQARLRLDASDPRWIWAIDEATGAAISVRLKDDPSLAIAEGPPTVLLSGDVVVGRDGDRLLGGCRDWISGAYHIGPRDIASR